MGHPSRDALWSYAALDLPVRRRAKVRAHALGCTLCGAEIRRATAAHRALGGLDALTPTSQEIEVWGAEILHRHDGHRRSLRRWVWAWGPAVAAAVALAIVLLPGEPHPPITEDGWATRGEAAAPIHLRLLCVSNDAADGVEITDAREPCRPGSYLKLLVGNQDSPRRSLLALLAVGGEVTPLYPSHFSAPLPALPASLTPMPGSKRVESAAHGTARIIALALDAGRIDEQDPLVRWGRTAAPGVYVNVLGRADAVVAEVQIDGEER